MRIHTTHTRDAALYQLRRANRWLIAGSVLLTGVFAEAAASAFPGKTTKAPAKHGGPASAPSRGSSTTTPKQLAPPAQTPQASSETPDSEGQSHGQEGPPATESQTPAQESQTPEAQTHQESQAPSQPESSQAAPESSAPAQEQSREPAPEAPVVSGGS